MTETNIHVRRMPTEEMLDIMFPLTQYAFHASPPFRDKEEWKETVRGREGVTYLALFEEKKAVAMIAGSVMTQHVRGAIYDASGVWDVVTDPAARRKGYSRRLMGSLLAAGREAGQAFSCLYPFRESFYERLGFVTFPLPRIARLKPSALTPLLKQDLGGSVDLVLIGDGYDAYRDYLLAMQRRVHGMAVFVHGTKAAAQKLNRSWLAFARTGQAADGLLLYQIKGEEMAPLTLLAHRFYSEGSPAKYLLLQWIARHVDQTSDVEIWLPPYEQPETWLSDLQVRTESQVRAPMGRVVDVAAIGGMHTGPGRFSARVNDPLCPWNEGVWQFETADGVLQVVRAAEADCNLSIQGLSALVYGTHNPGDFRFRDWGNPSEETRVVMRTMFPPMTPYLHEYF